MIQICGGKAGVEELNEYNSSMNLAKCSIFFFLLHPFLLQAAGSKCSDYYSCGSLGILEFPLSDTTEPECGLFVVDCYTTPPRIQLEAGGTWYNILQKLSTNKFSVEDPFLNAQMSDTTCFSFQNQSLPDSPFSSFTVSPNLTIFSCAMFLDHNNKVKIQDYFQNYKNYTSCELRTLYYKDPAYGFTSREISIPGSCSVIQMPVKSNQSSANLVQLLSAEFDLEWTISADCLSCHSRGGKCRTNSDNGFWCAGGVTMVALASTPILLFLFMRGKYTLLKLLGLRKAKPEGQKDIELFLKNNENLALKRYKYSDLKKITKRFSENLGKGGYGSVYKGKLPDGRLVAVKVLNESKGNGDEFMNEVASISRTSHINIVSLLGFCFEGSKKALIYEFMPNGSLEKFIQNAALSSAEGGLGWEKLFEIAVGVARGLEYLHRGCNTRILHFDIKPHNILLDKDLNPKISDFGLAKLCSNRSSVVSMLVARGTMGYIAPEVFCRNFGQVSHKSDVYSYGMMVLEIAGGRKNIDPADVDRWSEVYFPNYIYKQLEMEAETGAHPDGIMNEDESQFAKRKLIIVGLWCIQTDPKDRPSMNKVVGMLEGELEYLQVPPKPYLSSPPRSAPTLSISVSV
ncbi:LEAF RUST 10 DISEASE-RESISTANCE LOCUS RECEPTOR-LIKE PROTEIN KINASE-like 2.5 isoform X2 [Sesamum indicum]|uniref:LEAF RUST 10 DISEASE-RESISTANCE LOCUS RECEPTOR-LIKE PROTEIN KINASE-like 2.5 isoform X2 n=1 Tax=Sesamum indicum TaxID=4182 RepID=A0A8M8UZ02_SESIN|nr:LEAF RUST 10 DISEASE-RESISTANCE LOCUS RECEPTOR-LIKE PROTEIN KINASE-like 2.5 isoform X2 [Sesamum indicum]